MTNIITVFLSECTNWFTNVVCNMIVPLLGYGFAFESNKVTKKNHRAPFRSIWQSYASWTREICKLVACGMSVPHHTWSGDRGYAMCNDNTQRGYETCNNNNIFVWLVWSITCVVNHTNKFLSLWHLACFFSVTNGLMQVRKVTNHIDSTTVV